jgi:hypothetical protein
LINRNLTKQGKRRGRLLFLLGKEIIISGKKTKEDLIVPLMSSTIRAKDIVQALTQQDTGLVHLILRHKKIRGVLDLKHRHIPVPLTFKNCEFLNEVDFRNCEFEQAVDFTGCTFRRGFYSGDEVRSHTVYKKDLDCSKAIFEGEVSFVGSRFESSASFLKAIFQNRDKVSDFRLASFEKSLQCNGATFKGTADFRGMRCGRLGLFKPTEEEAGSDHNTYPVTFEREVKFRFASFGINLQCDRAIFKDQADFAFITCEDNAVFTLCRFEGEGQEVSFYSASMGGMLDCSGATFKGPANFNGMKCGAAAFFLPAKLEDEEVNGTHSVTFERAVQFRFASLGANLECNQAVFKDQVDCSFLQCGNSAIFTLCRFEGERQGVTLYGASLGGNLECYGATFKGPANFSGIKCVGSGLFNPVEVKEEEGDHTRTVSFGQTADFRFSTFDVNLECTDVAFEGSVNFVSVRCRNNMFLSSARFQNEMGRVELTRASIEGALLCDGQATF